MTPRGTQEDNPALRLARYLKEFVGLRTTTVRDVTKYDSVLWFGDMPQEPDCRSGAWADDRDPDAPWLEVRKQEFERAPSPPEQTRPWVDENALERADLEFPELRSTIFLPDDEVELDEGETPPLIEHSLSDYPEVKRAYERYRPGWQAWAMEHRRRSAIQRVYADLFRLHTQVLKQGEIVEVVIGLGLTVWRAKLNQKDIPIRRHAIVGRAELEFDSVKGVIRVVPPGDGTNLRIEDDMLEAELRPDRSDYATVAALLNEVGDDIWDEALTHTALKAWAGALSPDSQWSDQLGALAPSGNNPAMSLAPALILRKRTQTGMVRIYDKLVDQLSGDSVDVPDGWGGLVDDVGDYTGDTKSDCDDPGRDRPPSKSSDVYFPLRANREQLRIVEAIDRQRGVLVQGPPGTGKSHTIANLICHLLATGQRVLITAETGRALQVLKKMLPEEIQPLCVSLLGQGGDAFAELNTAVQGITTRQAAYSPGSYDDRIAEIDRDLDKARRRLSEIDDVIRSFREEETCPHSVGNGDYHGTASAIADRVAEERDQYSWLKRPSNAEEESELSNEDLVAWLEISRRYTEEAVSEAKLQIPPSVDLLTPVQFAATIAEEQAASTEVKQIEKLRSHVAYHPILTLAPNLRERLRGELQKEEQQRLAFGRLGDDWKQDAITDSLAGRKARWNTVLELSSRQLPVIESLLERVGTRIVTMPDGVDVRKVRADTATVLKHFHDGGKWKRFGLITPQKLKGLVYLKHEVLVDGEGASDSEKLQLVCDHLDLDFALADLRSIWDGVAAAPLSDDRRLCFATLQEQAAVLEKCTLYADRCSRLARAMAGAAPSIPVPDWQAGEAQDWLKLIDAASVESRLSAASQAVDSCGDLPLRISELHDAHPVAQKLAQAIEARDVNAYSLSHASIVMVEKTRADQLQRLDVERVLSDSATGLVESVSSSLEDPRWDARLREWTEAWHWAVADAWLEKRSDLEYQQKCWKRRHDVEVEIGGLLGEAAALRAWTYFFDRLSPRESAALKSWREAVRAQGKGTGKSAKMARLRKEARQYMDACRDAIPVWIMPRYLVAEMVDPAPCRYDIVIVDEASQLGIESLFLFYIAKKMVVVGDDQQISPYGVGVADAAIAGLQQHYLNGIPHHHALSAQSSLYSNAKIRFSQNIVLREHFRCMPEIIQFSNDLCYAINGTPLDPLRAYPANRLQPIVLRHVTDGYRIGGHQNAQNPPEADAIVAQIEGCIADSRYDGATMGVISLQGDSQAKLIERKILDTLDPAVLEERRLICGDAYAFQGDERKIIFLSMVAAPGETRIGALTDESARQRFNVAVSRAQDQLWLFHTANLDVLSDACMRHRLLSYMLNPGRQAGEEHRQRFDSKFERDVFRRITDKGFHVRTQVCVGDPTNHRYRIDLVVDGMQGRLAVECDGEHWHGPERYEHDMARQRDLERAGWQFIRIGGGDFYRNQAEAMKPVWAELDRLGIQPGGVDDAAGQPPAPVDRIHASETSAVESKVSEPPAATAKPERTMCTPREADVATETRPDAAPVGTGIPDVTVEEDTPQSGEAGSPCLFPSAAASTNESKGRVSYVSFNGASGDDPRNATTKQVAEGLCRIIDVEGPMLAKRAYDIYLRGCGIHRMGGELKRSMNKALQLAIRKGEIVKEDESGKGGLVYSIVRSVDTPPVLVRARGPRDFVEIPPSELQLVARKVLSDRSIELGSDAHLRAVLEFFDLKRLTVQVGTTLLDVLDRQYPYVDEIIQGDAS